MLVTSNTFDAYKEQQLDTTREIHEQIQNLHEEIGDLVKSNQQLTKLFQGQQSIIKSLSDQLTTQDETINNIAFLKQRKESDAPWIEVLGGDVDPEKGLQLNLDWNDAFIDQLRAQGYRGTTEGSLVGQWLLAVSQNVAGEEADA